MLHEEAVSINSVNYVNILAAALLGNKTQKLRKDYQRALLIENAGKVRGSPSYRECVFLLLSTQRCAIPPCFVLVSSIPVLLAPTRASSSQFYQLMHALLIFCIMIWRVILSPFVLDTCPAHMLVFSNWWFRLCWPLCIAHAIPHYPVFYILRSLRQSLPPPLPPPENPRGDSVFENRKAVLVCLFEIVRDFISFRIAWAHAFPAYIIWFASGSILLFASMIVHKYLKPSTLRMHWFATCSFSLLSLLWFALSVPIHCLFPSLISSPTFFAISISDFS